MPEHLSFERGGRCAKLFLGDATATPQQATRPQTRCAVGFARASDVITKVYSWIQQRLPKTSCRGIMLDDIHSTGSQTPRIVSSDLLEIRQLIFRSKLLAVAAPSSRRDIRAQELGEQTYSNSLLERADTGAFRRVRTAAIFVEKSFRVSKLREQDECHRLLFCGKLP